MEVGFGVRLGMRLIPTFALRVPPAEVQGALQGASITPERSETCFVLGISCFVPDASFRGDILLRADGHLHRGLFGQMLRRIYALPVPSR